MHDQAAGQFPRLPQRKYRQIWKEGAGGVGLDKEALNYFKKEHKFQLSCKEKLSG